MRATLLAWMPIETIPLLFVAAGIAVMLGARWVAAGFAAAGVVAAVLPVVLGPLFDQLPLWTLYLVMFIMVAGLGLGLAKSILGGRAWDHMVGILAADVVRWTFLSAFRLLVGIIVLPLRALVHLFRR
jgi:hypothetical protein